jgi:hypothetical protein
MVFEEMRIDSRSWRWGTSICLVLGFGETDVSDKRGRTAGTDDNLDVRAIVDAMLLFWL